MKFKKLLNILAAVVVAGCSTFGAYAESNITLEREPAISFDSGDWKKYVAKTKDADKANITLDTANTKGYQALSLQIKGKVTDTVGEPNFTYSKYLKKKDGKKLYPLSGVDGVQPSTIGIEISAKKFGLSTFDNCTIEFTYRFGDSLKSKLLQDSAFVYPTDDYYKVLTENPVKLKYDDSEKDNVGQYGKAVLNVKKNLNSTKIVFELPITKKLDESVLMYLDNIVIRTPQKKGNKHYYVANVDSYNSGATPAKINEKANVQNKDKTEEVYGDTSTKSDKLNPLFIAGGVIIGVAVVAGIVVLVIKRSKKFY